ncbi:MAG TPA: acyl carrier protein [Anaerolineales bacterium]|nr:acyl carrier protein [Anaerolineales bacterium]
MNDKNLDSIVAAVKEYILTEFLPGENPDELTDATPLMSGGILDSLATLRLVSFIEERFNVQVEPHEMGAEYFDSLTEIAKLIHSKL